MKRHLESNYVLGQLRSEQLSNDVVELPAVALEDEFVLYDSMSVKDPSAKVVPATNRQTKATEKLLALRHLFDSNPRGWLPGKDHVKLRRMWYMCVKDNRYQALFFSSIAKSANMRHAYSR